MNVSNTDYQLEQLADYWRGQFFAMASPCELLIETESRHEAESLLKLAQAEALRIEHKFSRYRSDNIIFTINHSAGEPVEVDKETAGLLDYAAQCYQLSEGAFDITSGVLREVWKFDGSDNVPDQQQITPLLDRIGWPKVQWQSPWLTLPAGMEIDLGGIGKEYAVDRTALLIQQQSTASVLINYGGDIYVNKPRRNGQGWVIGVEDPKQMQPLAIDKNVALKEYELSQGGIATSGDARRYLLKNGVRYSHILDPRSGWPVKDAPRSVTVAAGTCTEAGILSTMAMLQGSHAEAFLQQQQVTFWCAR